MKKIIQIISLVCFVFLGVVNAATQYFVTMEGSERFKLITPLCDIADMVTHFKNETRIEGIWAYRDGEWLLYSREHPDGIEGIAKLESLKAGEGAWVVIRETPLVQTHYDQIYIGFSSNPGWSSASCDTQYTQESVMLKPGEWRLIGKRWDTPLDKLGISDTDIEKNGIM